MLLDRICATPCTHLRCEDNTMRVYELMALNPRSIFSTKVTYNIGRARAARVRAMHEASRARAGASLPSRRKALVGDSLPTGHKALVGDS
jgi:hypothetical protein